MILSLLDIDQRVGLYRLISHKLYKTTLVPSNKSDKKKKKTNRKVFYRLHIVLIFQGFALSYFIIPTQNKNKTHTHTHKNNENKTKQNHPPQKTLLKSNIQNMNNIIFRCTWRPIIPEQLIYASSGSFTSSIK